MTCCGQKHTRKSLLGLVIDTLAVLVVLGVSLMAVVASLELDMAALVIIYSLSLNTNLNLMASCSAELAVNLVCVERLQELTRIEQEEQIPTVVDSQSKTRSLSAAVGSRGGEDNSTSYQQPSPCIEWINYSARYHSSNSEQLALAGINLRIEPGQTVGIIGRTGCGKSSLILSLFRLLKVSTGQIRINGVDIGDLDLARLRSSITFLPQDPILFTGTLRSNLDPNNSHSDADLYQAIRLVGLQLTNVECDNILDSKIDKHGIGLVQLEKGRIVASGSFADFASSITDFSR